MFNSESIRLKQLTDVVRDSLNTSEHKVVQRILNRCGTETGQAETRIRNSQGAGVVRFIQSRVSHVMLMGVKGTHRKHRNECRWVGAL